MRNLLDELVTVEKINENILYRSKDTMETT